MCIKGLASCACPPPPLPPQVFDPVKPRYRSPIDCLGYPTRCCRCLPLRIGVGIICFLSFVWALFELSRSESTMASIYPEKDDIFKAIKLIHIFIITAYLASCGALMLGVITIRYKPINIFVWIALMFNCICIVVTFVSIMCQIATGMIVKRRLAFIMTAGVLWHCLFFYFIAVVNSYKYHVLARSVFE